MSLHTRKKAVYLTQKEKERTEKSLRELINKDVASQRVGLRKIALTKNVCSKTVKNWFESVKNGQSLLDANLEGTRKKSSKSKYEKLEKVVLQQAQSLRRRGISVLGPSLTILLNKHKQKLLEDPNVSNSDKEIYRNAKFGKNYISSFKKRHGFRKLKLNGERCVIPENIDELMEPITHAMNTLGMSAENTFNFDETGLFTRALPGYTLAQKHDDGGGSKKDKMRITAGLLVNSTGTFRKLIIIGKSKTPRGTSKAFFDEHDIDYKYNETAWMTEELFQKFLFDWDKELDHHVLLLLDNFAGHDIDKEYENIVILFLPPNTTSATQPLDAGLIAVFKAKYRTKLLSYILQRIEEAASFSMREISVKLIIPWIKESWLEVKNSTVLKCFQKCVKSIAIMAENENSVVEDDNSLELLRLAMENTLHRSVTEMEALDYAIPATEEDEEEILKESELNDDNMEDEIRIADPKVIMKQLENCREYFQATGEAYLSELVAYQIAGVYRHLNFE